MARPRVFISSTFYDLRHIRNDLEVFVRDMGYEPILHERGHVAYGASEKLEEYAYQEVDRSDILVAIVGGRYGTASQYGDYSISNVELRQAIQARRQVYVFIEGNVRAEFETYLLNKDNAKTKYRFVDDPRVYSWIEELQALPANNATSSFEAASDIVSFLKEQWAGLFQRMLEEQRMAATRRVAEDLSATADTLRRVVASLGSGSLADSSGVEVEGLLFENHPIFSRLKRLFDVEYRVFFTTKAELTAWLKETQGFTHAVSEGAQDDPDYLEWIRGLGDDGESDYDLLKVAAELFDDRGHLVSVDVDEFQENWVKIERRRGWGVRDDPVLEERTGARKPPAPRRVRRADRDSSAQ